MSHQALYTWPIALEIKYFKKKKRTEKEKNQAELDCAYLRTLCFFYYSLFQFFNSYFILIYFKDFFEVRKCVSCVLRTGSHAPVNTEVGWPIFSQ